MSVDLGAFVVGASIQVLLEDNHLLAIHKPAGVSVQADRSGRPSIHALCQDYLKRRYAKPGRVYLGIVHRLDRPVAGVLLFARTSKAAGRLCQAFRSRQVAKRYLAVVHGRPEPSEGGAVDHLLWREGRAGIVAPGTEGAREARLTYRVKEFGLSRSLLEIDLETGRKHQIRAQLAALGHPIVGDERYGAPGSLPDGSIALFARALTFPHPTKKTSLTIEARPGSGWPWP